MSTFPQSSEKIERLSVIPYTCSIYEYFIVQLQRAPADDSLQSCPVESVCGQTCKATIDAARILMRCVRQAYGEDSDAEWRLQVVTSDVVETFWRG